MNSIKMTLTVPGHIDYMPVAIAFIKESARVFGFPEEELLNIHLAAEEALVNTILHGLNNDPREEYTVTCHRLPTRMEVVIRDKGMPFSAAEIPDYDPALPADPDAVDGLGLYLLKRSVDEVKFHNLGREGKETILIKNIASKRIDNLIDQITPNPIVAPIVVDSWRLRLFEPDDALEISRCAFQTYGYTYEPYIYYPERITEMNAAGELVSIVAVDDRQQLMGHIALKFYYPEDPVAEIGVAFVTPAYRNNNIFGKMCQEAFKKAAHRGLLGLYGRAVTSHVLSQKKILDFGFVSCGVILGLFPADVDFKGLTGKIIQKESALLIFMPFETPTRIIYPPARHAEVIDEIFVRCKIGVTVGDLSSACHGKDEVPSRTNTRLSYSRIEVFNTADIFCYADDIGMVNDILAAKKQLCVERTDVLFLFLDLEQPGCMELAEACEAMGFFFAGVLPYGLNGKHTLILQFLNNLTIDYTKIALCDPFAQHLLDYVQLCGQAN